MKRVKQNDTFDVIKAVMAVMITIIHIVSLDELGIIGTYIFPILRIAVPLFFMISSYLFFSRINMLKTYEERKRYLCKAIRRNLQLYLLWFVILSPITLYIRGYFEKGLLIGLLTLVWNFFVGSTFIASWYIMALIIGLTVVFYLTTRFSNLVVFSIGILTYAFCVLTSNYGKLAIMTTFHDLLLYWTPYNSFTAGIIWIIAGKIFAENKNAFYFGIKKQKIIISGMVLLLYLEQILIVRLNSSHTTDFYFMLVPLCLSLFALLLNTNLHNSRAKQLRAFSTVTYCLHASFAKIPSLFFLMLGLSNDTFLISLVKWIMTIIVCACITLLIIKLEKFKFFQWMKLLH
ncbi:acyltransferase family protein [Pediococcus stilesii]|uniref:Acyltransferase 3 domain-containing protein n=1 Tax=Pediococcus stilesii TaxID=331679 RepID=A0A0R2L4J8_9LACO|nr:acyltransferase family protein [Pediococcus stilesii]KRN94726.1 hypothetical protein IV81_GL001002 [Pediococcus stilesii]